MAHFLTLPSSKGTLNPIIMPQRHYIELISLLIRGIIVIPLFKIKNNNFYYYNILKIQIKYLQKQRKL